MLVELPLPRDLMLLTLALPGVFVAGAEVAAWLTRRRLLRVVLAPVLALTLWLLAVHTAGLLSRSFVTGLRVGTLGVAVAGLAARVGRKSPASSVGRGLGPGALLLLAATAVPVAWMASGWAFHDEDLITGHMSIPAEMANDIYPPRHLTFAAEPLRYHYGFDLLVAVITALARARVDTGIDVATVILWLVTGAVLWALGDLWFRRGWLLVPMTLFAGGLPLCAWARAHSARDLLAQCPIGTTSALHPLVSNFFQHPWALGIPVALAVLLVFSARDREGPTPRLVVMGILLAALSFAHVVLFVTVLPSVVAAELWHLHVTSRRPLSAGLGIVATAVGVVLAAALLRGSFTSFGSTAAPSALVIRPGMAGGLADTLRWHAQSHGPALLLALAGVPLLPRRGRLVTALLLGGSLLVLDTVQYAHSGDIIKFGVVATLAMALAGTATVSRILDARRGQRVAPRALLGATAAALLVASTAGGAGFALVFFTRSVDGIYAHGLTPLAPDDVRAASFLRARVKPGEIVFRQQRWAAGYAQFAGLPVPWSDWGTDTFGFPPALRDARDRLLKTLPPDPAAYLAEGIDWFVLEPADGALALHARAWITAGRATELATFGKLRVIKLTPPRMAPR